MHGSRSKISSDSVARRDLIPALKGYNPSLYDPYSPHTTSFPLLQTPSLPRKVKGRENQIVYFKRKLTVSNYKTEIF
jgi:hypothetical protein